MLMDLPWAPSVRCAPLDAEVEQIVVPHPRLRRIVPAPGLAALGMRLVDKRRLLREARGARIDRIADPRGARADARIVVDGTLVVPAPPLDAQPRPPAMEAKIQRPPPVRAGIGEAAM